MTLTAKELQIRAIQAAGFGIGGTAASIPIAVGRDDVSVGVFFYRELATPGARVVYPPTHLVRLDRSTGAILFNAAVSPARLGRDAPADTPLPRHPDERRLDDPDAFWADYHLLLDTFHEAFALYADARVRFTDDERGRIARSLALFTEVAEKRVRPWYDALGAPFFAWMRGVAAPVG